MRVPFCDRVLFVAVAACSAKQKKSVGYMSDILNPSVADPRGETLVAELIAQDLSALSAGDLIHRIKALEAEVSRCQVTLDKRQGATAAAEALFKGR